MLRLFCVLVPLVFFCFLFTLWLLVDHQHAATNSSSNMTVWPTQPGRKFDPVAKLRTLLRMRREGKPSRKERKLMAKYFITTTKPTHGTKRKTSSSKTTTRLKKHKPGRSTRRAYTLDIRSEDYSAKKHCNANVNPAQYAYEHRMSASREVKSILVKDIRKQFFSITAHRSKLSQLEILKNQSRVLYDNYMKIINKSTTINWWRLLRDARYNNTSPNVDLSATLWNTDYPDMFVYGGTTPETEDPLTVAASIVKAQKEGIRDMLKRVPPGRVNYDVKDVLGSSGIVE